MRNYGLAKAQMQLSILGMKKMGVTSQSQAMQFTKGNTTSSMVVP